MTEHLYKTVIEHKGKHGMRYGCFLTKVVHHLNIPVGACKIGTAKQSFTLRPLVECECVEGKANTLSKLCQLIKAQDQLKHELAAMTILVRNKEAEISLLKAKLLKAQTEGPGTKVVRSYKSRMMSSRQRLLLFKRR